MTDRPLYGIADLATLGGVSRRTVRYYVQEGLLPAPLGVGRGQHYGPEHLEHLLQVKALQERGSTLADIRRALAGRTGPQEASGRDAAVERSLWRRLTLAPGVELHLASDVRLPGPGRLEELAEWCRAHLARGLQEDHEEHD